MKRFILLFTFVMKVVLGLFSLSLLSCGVPSSSPDPTITPIPNTIRQVRQSYVVERGDVINQVNISGRIVPVTQSDLFFKNNGRIHQIYVKKNAVVKKGDVLADLVGLDVIERDLQLREIGLARAQIIAENARLGLDLFKKTTSPNISGYQEMLKTKENEVKMAELAIEETELILGEFQQAITDSLLLSPLNGTVLSLFIEPGSPVEAYESIGSMANINDLEVGIQSIPEGLINLEIGTEVVISPRKDNSKIFQGTVRQISTNRLNESMAGDQMRINILSDIKENGFELGDLLDVSLILDKSMGTLWLPPSAIRRFEGRSFVVVQDGDIQRRTDVRLGVLSEDKVEILSGLEEGQIVIGQ